MHTRNLSVFYPDKVIHKLKANAETNQQIKSEMEEVIKDAQRFVTKDDSKLWDLVVDPYIMRSHYVNKNSLCPVCGKKRLLYDWDMDPISYPWKVRCPDCDNLFPKNDYYAFYKSGIDDTGNFNYDKADKTYLYNSEHPDPNDLLHLFAVDDGNGYQNSETIQRFIGAYLIHGHYKDLIQGIASLSYAYLYTGSKQYAHKCAVLLDRFADHWPNYDARSQVYMYDVLNVTEGYVGYWYGSYSDISTIAYAYDMIRGEILEDKELLTFIQSQKLKYGIPHKKDNAQDICNHIETRILRDAIANYKKCRSNFPMTHALYAVIHAVLGNHDQVDLLLEEIITQSTQCDGASKENGLTGYTNTAKIHLTKILIKFINIKPGYIDEMMKKHPSLIESYRFFIDTLCIDEYYPKIGDCGVFAEPSYGCIHKGAETLFMLYKCYKTTGDTLYLKAILSSTKGDYAQQLAKLDFLNELELDEMIQEIDSALRKEGYEMILPSVVKPNWHLAILRSGKGKDKRALWIDFDWINSGHEHSDPMNIGLFCKGIDMMPDWGYPTVVYDGGFSAKECTWGKSVFVHNCVTLDRSPGRKGEGRIELWSPGKHIKTITCQNPEMVKEGKQYARTLSLVDVSQDDSYIVDIFRICGNGRLYERYMHAAVGSLTTDGIQTKPVENEFESHLFFENVRRDDNPKHGWHADFQVEDYFGYVDEKRDWHLKCTDLTYGSGAIIADMRFFGNRNYEQKLEHELLLPCVITTKLTDAPFEPVVFVQVIEPYEGKSNIYGIERLINEKVPDGCIVIQITTKNYTDLLIYNNTYQQQNIDIPTYMVKTDAMVSFIRMLNGSPQYICYSKGSYFEIGDLKINISDSMDTVEVDLNKDKNTFISGAKSSYGKF